MTKTKIRKNDVVQVIAGRDKGKQGRVIQVDRKKGRVLVEHVMMIKKHVRPNPQKQIKGRSGGERGNHSPVQRHDCLVGGPRANRDRD